MPHPHHHPRLYTGGSHTSKREMGRRGFKWNRDIRLGDTQRWYNESAFIFLFIINLLNYVDRGIIPGAEAEFSSFVSNSLDTNSPDLYVGLLQSAFIVGFSLAALVFGHAIHYFPPFKMVGVGLCIWLVATALCGLAQQVGKYQFLFMARMLSGVGEASFQCVAPPFITDLAGDAGGRWLALFYTAIPLGTAIGYPWGSLFAASSLGWSGAFYVECLLMAPLALSCFVLPFTWRPERAPIEEEDEEEAEAEDMGVSEGDNNGHTAAGEAKEHEILVALRQDADARVQAETRHISVWGELCAVVRRPIYVLNALGYAANTGMMIGVSTFGSALMLEFGYFKRESSASSVFGIALSIAGIVGTSIGGWLIDRKHSHSEEAKLAYILRQNVIFATLGGLCSCISCFVYNRELFLLFFVMGALLLFVCTAGINLVTMLAVNPPYRSFAIAVCTLTIHAFGDVPSPIVVGAILDGLAPACAADRKEAGKATDTDFIVSEACKAQVPKLRLTLFITCMWLSITVICWALAWAVAWKQYKAHHQHHQHHQHQKIDDGAADKEKEKKAREGLREPLL